MVFNVDLNSVLLTTWIMQIISNILAGLGIGIGVYFAFKRLMPTWIQEITKVLKERHTIDRALEMRGKYG